MNKEALYAQCRNKIVGLLGGSQSIGSSTILNPANSPGTFNRVETCVQSGGKTF
jgi:hypothetical protein